MAENPYMLTPEEQLIYAAQDPAHPFIDPRVVSAPIEFALNPQKYGYRNLLEAGVDAAGQVAPYVLYNMSPGGVPVTAARNMASDWQNPYMPNWQKVVNSAADLLGVTMMAAPTQIGRMGARAFDYIDDAVKNPYVMSPLRNEVGAVRLRDMSAELQNKLIGTKVVDDSGELIPVYHGTLRTFPEYSASKVGINTDAVDTKSGPAFFFSDKPNLPNVFASMYGGNVRQEYLNLKDPWIAEVPKHSPSLIAEQIDMAKAAGKDGVVLKIAERYKNSRGKSPGMIDTGTVYVAFDPSQIVNAISPENYSISQKPW